MGLALVLALIVAPEDADQGISQRIFYLHVPIALTAYGRVKDRMLSLAAGYSMHVPKPVDPGELTMIVASVAGRTAQPTP